MAFAEAPARCAPMDRRWQIVLVVSTLANCWLGMQIVHDQWLNVLKQQEVEEIAPAPGTPFDPSKHEALMQQDAVYGAWNDLKSVPVSTIERLRHYFLTYKDAPGSTQRKSEITHIYGRSEAHDIIRRSQEDYRARFGRLDRRLAELVGAATPDAPVADPFEELSARS